MSEQTSEQERQLENQLIAVLTEYRRHNATLRDTVLVLKSLVQANADDKSRTVAVDDEGLRNRIQPIRKAVHTNLPSLGIGETLDILENDIVELVTQLKEQLLERVEREVIKGDVPVPSGPRAHGKTYAVSTNKRKAEQRTALNEIRKGDK